jgi:hypothetical protein
VAFLERQGVTVELEPPDVIGRRSLGADAAEVVVLLVASGTYDAIKAGIKGFRERSKHGTIKVDGEPDNGGLFD